MSQYLRRFQAAATGARRLTAFLVVVVLLGPTAASGTAPPTKPALKVATWNIAWLHHRDGAGPIRRTPADYKRLAAYFARLDADVVALQEVSGPAAALRIAPKGYRFYFAAGHGAQRVGFAVRESIAVKHRPDLKTLDVGGLRSGAVLHLRTARGPLRLLAVHLKAGCRKGPLDKPGRACSKLNRQLTVLAAWVAAQPTRGGFMIIGDFNRHLDETEPFWQALTKTGRVSSPTVRMPANCWKFKRLVDHIVLGGHARAWLRGPVVQHRFDKRHAEHRRVLSDHCPLSASLAR